MFIVALGLSSGTGYAQDDNTPRNDTTVYEPGPLIKIPVKSSTLSFGTVKGSRLSKSPNANNINAMPGLIPGLTVLQGGGEPGYDAGSLYIRGLGSYNSTPLTVFVDGYQSNIEYFQYLAPNEIQNISILKDAAALAPFGMRGANGILWVTTKRGLISKPVINLELQTGLQQPTVLKKPLSSYEYAKLYNEAYSNDNGGWQQYYNDAALQNLENGTGINTDWYDAILRNSAPLSRADVSVRGGTDAAKYFVLLGYMNNTGLYNIKNDDTHSNSRFQQFNIRTNVDFTLLKIFEGNLNIGGRTEDRHMPNYSGWDLWQNLARYPNIIYPLINTDGTYPGTTIHPNNPYATIRELGYASTHDRTLMATFDLKEKLDFIAKGLYLNQGISFNTWTRGSYNVTKNYARMLNGVAQTTDQNTNYQVYDDYGTNQWNRLQFQAGLGYSYQQNAHKLDAGFAYMQNVYNIDANINEDNNINMDYALQNISGRIHYDWNNKYIAEFGFAYSGSDNFKKGNRFGFYPAISLAWNIINNDNVVAAGALDFLKVRASAGTAGNDYYASGRYLFQKYYTSMGGVFATGNGEPVWHNGLGLSYVPNDEIFAEKSTKFNIGADARVLQHLSVSLDAFYDKHTGVVTPDYSVLGVFGTTPPFRNVGEVTSSGFETQLVYTKNTGTFQYSLGGNAGYAKNKINYMAEFDAPSSAAAKTGKPIGTSIGYEAIGFYNISDFNADGSLKTGLAVPQFGSVQPGDAIYRDVSGDGFINDFDKVEIGNSYLPSLTYAAFATLRYKGIDFNFLLQGVGGRSVSLLDARDKIIAFENNGNAYAIAQNRWAYYPDQGIDTRATATMPRLSLQSNNNNYQYSSLWVRNGNFIRMRHIEFGYTLPSSVLNQRHFPNVRFYVNLMNPFTISKLMKDYRLDPEVMTGYPALRSTNIGLSIQF